MLSVEVGFTDDRELGFTVQNRQSGRKIRCRSASVGAVRE